MREYTDNTRIAKNGSPLIKHEPEVYYNWKRAFLKECYVGRPLKINWIKNPSPTSTLSKEAVGGTKKYVITSITNKILVLESEHWYRISVSFTDIYSHNNIKYIDFRV